MQGDKQNKNAQGNILSEGRGEKKAKKQPPKEKTNKKLPEQRTCQQQASQILQSNKLTKTQRKSHEKLKKTNKKSTPRGRNDPNRTANQLKNNKKRTNLSVLRVSSPFWVIDLIHKGC